MTKRDIRKADEKLKLRSFQFLISDNDLEHLAEICGRSGITITELFETFVGDITRGVHYSGSDEAAFIDRWFDRHCFDLVNKDSLLVHILNNSYRVDVVDDFLTCWDEKAYYKEHPEEEIPDSHWWEKELANILNGFKREPTEDDVKIVREWWEEYQRVNDSAEVVDDTQPQG